MIRRTIVKPRFRGFKCSHRNKLDSKSIAERSKQLLHTLSWFQQQRIKGLHIFIFHRNTARIFCIRLALGRGWSPWIICKLEIKYFAWVKGRECPRKAFGRRSHFKSGLLIGLTASQCTKGWLVKSFARLAKARRWQSVGKGKALAKSRRWQRQGVGNGKALTKARCLQRLRRWQRQNVLSDHSLKLSFNFQEGHRRQRRWLLDSSSVKNWLDLPAKTSLLLIFIFWPRWIRETAVPAAPKQQQQRQRPALFSYRAQVYFFRTCFQREIYSSHVDCKGEDP